MVELLREAAATTLEDVGCGDGSLLKTLLSESGDDVPFERLVGIDIDERALRRCARKLGVLCGCGKRARDAQGRASAPGMHAAQRLARGDVHYASA